MRLTLVVALWSSACVFVTLVATSPDTARDIGILYAGLVATGSAAFQIDQARRHRG